jgi:Na+-transporting NADH:ubiquinone oxidoreductase subunit C
MWSTLYGLVALEADLNTIAAATFFEQAETAGLGDQIEDPAWLASWQGRRLFGPSGDIHFQVAPGPVEAGSPAAAYQVDGLSGATITGNAVTALVRFWFGPYGYGPLLEQLRDQEG